MFQAGGLTGPICPNSGWPARKKYPEYETRKKKNRPKW